MSWPGSQYFPHTPGFLLLFALILAALMLLLRFVLLDYALLGLGVSRRSAVFLLWASLVGSSINIPVARMPAEHLEQETTVDYFGMTYVVPHIVERGRTVIAVNVGGAVIPTLLSIYFVARFGLPLGMLIAILIVTWVVHAIAYPVAGVGITMPPFVAALVSAGAALLLDRPRAPRTAFVAGTMGTLIGADLLNLGKLNTMGAPVASIGGAGTFDGVFITGITAVLLTGISYVGRGKEPWTAE